MPSILQHLNIPARAEDDVLATVDADDFVICAAGGASDLINFLKFRKRTLDFYMKFVSMVTNFASIFALEIKKTLHFHHAKEIIATFAIGFGALSPLKIEALCLSCR